MQYWSVPVPVAEIARLTAGHGEPLKGGTLAFGHRHHRAGERGEGDGLVDQKHRVDGAGVLRDLLDGGPRLTPASGIAGAGRVRVDASCDHGRHAQREIRFRGNGGVVHVGRGSHHGGRVSRQGRLVTDAAVVLVVADLRNHTMQLVVSCAFAALMIQEITDAIGLPAVLNGGAHDSGRARELRDEEPSLTAHDEPGPLDQDLPAHDRTSVSPSCER